MVCGDGPATNCRRQIRRTPLCLASAIIRTPPTHPDIALKQLLALLIFSLFSALTVGDELPAAGPLFASSLHDLNDKPVALAKFRGKPLIVNFWARWCAPCRAEIPELIEFRKQHQGKIEVLGIGIEDEAGPARAFAELTGMNYPAFVAKEKGIPLMRALANTKSGLPYTLYIDRHGQVIGKKYGLLRKADLDAAAVQLLKD